MPTLKKCRQFTKALAVAQSLLVSSVRVLTVHRPHTGSGSTWLISVRENNRLIVVWMEQFPLVPGRWFVPPEDMAQVRDGAFCEVLSRFDADPRPMIVIEAAPGFTEGPWLCPAARRCGMRRFDVVTRSKRTVAHLVENRRLDIQASRAIEEGASRAGYCDRLEVQCADASTPLSRFENWSWRDRSGNPTERPRMIAAKAEHALGALPLTAPFFCAPGRFRVAVNAAA